MNKIKRCFTSEEEKFIQDARQIMELPERECTRLFLSGEPQNINMATTSVSVQLKNYSAYDYVDWSSSNENICIVEGKGANNKSATITSLNSGNCIIYAELGDQKIAINITVETLNPTIRLSSSATVNVGKQKTISASISNYNKYTEWVTWTVSDPYMCKIETNDAECNKTVLIEGIYAGECTLTATLRNGTSASMTIKTK